MREINIKELVDINNYLNKYISNNVIIVGKIDEINIKYKYIQLDLSRVECNKIEYWYQEGESIKTHMLPKSLIELYCNGNKLTSLPKLPNSLIELNCSYNQLALLPKLPSSLKELDCSYNQLTSFANTQLPNSLKFLHCDYNQLTSLPNLPNSLIELHCEYNQLTSLPILSDSLEKLYCYKNKLTLLPDILPNSLKELYCNDNLLSSFNNSKIPISLEKLYCHKNKLISFPDYLPKNLCLMIYQDMKLDYLPYYENIKLLDGICFIRIKGYNKNINNQEDWDEYMNFKLNQMNRIKSARK